MRTFLTSIFTLFTAAAANACFGQASATAGAQATIVTPISMTKTSDLNFGNVAVAASSSGTVVLAPGGSRTAGGSGGVTLPSTSGAVSAAQFTVAGQPNFTYSITLPASCSISNGAHSMTVTSFTSTPSTSGTLSSSGLQTLSVGATLSVAAAQNTGTYSNSAGVPVTVNYN